MKLDRGHDERGGSDGRDCKSKRERKARKSDNEVMCPFLPTLQSHGCQLGGPRSPPTQYTMADPELAALRAARLTQLQQSGTDANGQSGASSEEAEKRRAEEQMKRDLLATALEPAARERRMSNCLLGSYAGNGQCIYSITYCARISHEVESDRVYPPADGTIWPAPGACQRATTHRSARAGTFVPP